MGKRHWIKRQTEIRNELIEDEIRFLDNLRDLDDWEKELKIHERIMELKNQGE
jgi:hypothetical protein